VKLNSNLYCLSALRIGVCLPTYSTRYHSINLFLLFITFVQGVSSEFSVAATL
jgi:hypothetical protein